METITKVINDNPDSIEIGTPGKSGTVKVYGDFSKPEEFEQKIRNARALREYANEQLKGE